MRFYARVIVPMFLAAVIAVGLLAFLWLQLHSSARTLQGQIQQTGTALADLSLSSAADFDTGGDAALLHLRQGDLYALDGNWKEAQHEYQASVDSDGGVPALKKLVSAQMQRRDLDGARNTIDRLRNEGARAEDILLLGVLVSLQEHAMDDAAHVLKEAGDSPQKHYGSALLALLQGDQATAKTEFQATVNGWEPALRNDARVFLAAYDEFAAFPESSPIHLQTLLARALAQVQECGLALPILDQVTQQQDSYRDAWIVRGYCQLTTEQEQEALLSLERAYAIDPEKPEIQYFLGRAYAALQDHKNAITFLEYALQNGFQPEHDVRRAIALEAQASGDTSLALEQLRVIATGSGADLKSMEQFVGIALQAEKKQDAYDAAQKAVQRWSDSGHAYYLLGLSAAALEKKDEARAAFEKALQLDPTIEDAKEKLLHL